MNPQPNRRDPFALIVVAVIVLTLMSLWIMRLEDRVTRLEHEVRVVEQEVRPLP